MTTLFLLGVSSRRLEGFKSEGGNMNIRQYRERAKAAGLRFFTGELTQTDVPATEAARSALRSEADMRAVFVHVRLGRHVRTFGKIRRGRQLPVLPMPH